MLWKQNCASAGALKICYVGFGTIEHFTFTFYILEDGVLVRGSNFKRGQ